MTIRTNNYQGAIDRQVKAFVRKYKITRDEAVRIADLIEQGRASTLEEAYKLLKGTP